MSRVMTGELSTKERLIEAAISIIEADGEVAIRVDQVAERAGFTKPVLYHHFDDREAIIAAAQAERFRRALEFGWDDLVSPLQTAGSAEEFFEVVKTWFNRNITDEGEMRRRFRAGVFGSALTRPALMQSVVETNRFHANRVAASLEMAQAKGWISPNVSAQDLANWWIGLIFSRFFFEIDKESFSTDNWDELTVLTLRTMINLSSGHTGK